MIREAARGATRTPLRARQRIWVSGIAVVMALLVFGALGVGPLVSSRGEDVQVRGTVLVLQEIADLRTALTAWQVYIEPHFADFSSAPAKSQPVELAKGAVLADTQAVQAQAVVVALNASGLTADADALQAANATYAKSIAGLAALDDGASAAVIATTVAAETTAFSRILATTSSSADRLRAQTALNLQAAVARLDNGRRAFLVADAIAAAVAIGGAFVLGQSGRRREVLARVAADRQEFENALQDGLEMARTESDAYDTMTRALNDSVPGLQVEMLVADSSRAHFHQTLHTGAEGDPTARSGCGVMSPFDCPATRRGHTLLFRTSRAINACPYLKDRPTGELAAACIPVSMTGQTSGVVHATGPDGFPPTAIELDFLELTARRVADRVAMLRAFEKSEAQARTDPLTGLWNRRSLENRMHDLTREGVQYALAYGDLDHFKALNDTHGHESGDQALRLFSRVLRDAIRPSDVTARYGGEEFVIVLPDCTIETATKILERLRERLALTLTTGRVPSFTVSFGLASSTGSDIFSEVVARADEALLTAKADGRNRTVVSAGERAVPHPGHVVPVTLPTA